MQSKKYKMSFSTGGLFLTESVEFAANYLELQDWDKVREHAIAENIIQSQAERSIARRTREILQRLQMLSSVELELLVEGSRHEQCNVLWIAICRTYDFIAEFALEVLRERYLSMQLKLTHDEFDFFFNQKAEWNDDLDKLSDTTRAKLRQVLFKILREAELLSDSGRILGAMLSSRVKECIAVSGYNDLLYFPVY